MQYISDTEYNKKHACENYSILSSRDIANGKHPPGITVHSLYPNYITLPAWRQ